MIIRTKAFGDGVWSDIWIIALVKVNELNSCIRDCHAQDHYSQKATWNGVDLGVATDVEVGHFLAKIILFPYAI